MKRLNNLYQQIISMDNLRLADAIARKGKKHQYGVQLHCRNAEANLLSLHQTLLSNSYKTSAYKTFTIFERKERLVYKLPFFPDRILHHAVMNVLEPLFVKTFTADTYSCIKNRGIHAAANAVKQALKDQPGTQYCLKIDIKKFYPSINHDVLKALLRKKFKDAQLLQLLDEIIDSAEGLPIGNYLSQYLANFYLSYFDHWIKEVLRIKYYFRYADDIVILASHKENMHILFRMFQIYLQRELKLTVKNNWRIFPVRTGIDFVGYVFFHTHTRLRKTIKQNFARMMARNKNRASAASYWGWAKHCNSNHLIKTLTKNSLHEHLTKTRHQNRNHRLYRKSD